METPVLTKNQQKRTLAGKKKPREKCLRNVLMKPKIFTNLVADEAVAENIFKTLESTINESEEQITSDVKTSKCDNPKRKTEKNKRQRVLKEKGLRKYLCLGVNEVARAVEGGHILSVLLEKDVDPQFMVSHIGTLCAVHNIPCIVVSGLRNGTSRAFGFPCICLGVKVVNSNEENAFAAMHQCILEVFHALSFSKSPTELQADSPVSVETTQLSEELENVEALAKPEAENKNVEDDKSFTAFYRYRTSTKERVFVPQGRKQTTDEFISIGSTEENITSLQSLKGISVNFSSLDRMNLKRKNKSENQSGINDFGVEYRLHEIKRIRPNPDKKKKLKVKKIKTVN
ncbi:uncharacterized protein LOC124596043 isoform X1 [Schistocerca americana]|uniref:uncharacterized protein LOC124596043 isoform X1 n=1 Tax=Schistocerca americana TaxID=7009 RepID=UPI001F4FDC16|nr:uncharacterized protein LOC124596043 isoform X1 [Schistocerca americana]